jgi:hypothetical protein
MYNLIPCLHPFQSDRVGHVGHKIALILILGALYLLVSIASAFGQTASSESVRKRPRLDYESFGFSFRALLGDKERSGPRKPADQLNVFTKAEVGTGYRSNVFRTPSNEKGSAFTKVVPRAAIRSDWDRHEVSLLFKADAELLASESGENKVDLTARAGGRYDLVNDDILNVDAEAARLQAARGSSNDVGPTFEPQIINRYTLGLGFVRGETDAVRLSANAKIVRYDFERVDALSRDEQDSTDFIFGGVAAINTDGPVALFLVPGLRFETYDKDTNTGSTIYDLALGWKFNTNSVSAGDGRIGISRRDYDRSGDPDLTSLLAENNLLWNATPLISVRSDSFVRTEDTQTEAGIGKIAAGIDLNVDYELFENLVFTSGMSYQNDRFKGISRTDDTYQYSLAAMYLIGEHYFVRGDLGFESRRSDDASQEYDETTIFLRFGIKTCCLSDAGLIDAFGEGVLDVFR